MTVASPRLIMCIASPMACRPVEHAVTCAMFGPFRFFMIASWPETMLMMQPGIMKGEMRRGPRSIIA